MNDNFYSKIKLTNAFNNHNGLGPLLVGVILEGDIKINDILIFNSGKTIPVLEIEITNIARDKRNFIITISREYDESEVWHKLYGTEIKIKNVE